MYRFLFICFSVFLLSHKLAAQTKYMYVSVNGNDKGAGTKNAPFKSIEKAVLASKRYKTVCIYLQEGTYYLDKTLVLKKTDIENASLKIVGQGKVLISAGRRLSLNWKPCKNGLYQANIPEGVSFERMYINGEFQHMARYVLTGG
jgi:hypothetical protein